MRSEGSWKGLLPPPFPPGSYFKRGRFGQSFHAPDLTPRRLRWSARLEELKNRWSATVLLFDGIHPVIGPIDGNLQLYLKTILHEVYVLPRQKKESLGLVQKLRRKVKGELAAPETETEEEEATVRDSELEAADANKGEQTSAGDTGTEVDESK